jgi:hypothetical protein
MRDFANMVNLFAEGNGIEVIGENNDIRPVYVPDTLNYARSRKLGLDVWIELDEAIKRTGEYYR